MKFSKGKKHKLGEVKIMKEIDGNLRTGDGLIATIDIRKLEDFQKLAEMFKVPFIIRFVEYKWFIHDQCMHAQCYEF